MTTYISRVEVSDLFGRMDLAIDLCPGVNVLYGRNGSGKTTLLHIIANILNGSFKRFIFIEFGYIRVFTGDGGILELTCVPADSEGEVILCATFNGEPVYTYQGIQRHVAPIRPRMVKRRLDVDREDAEFMAKPPDWLGLGGVVYFPAFRSTIEAWSDQLIRTWRSGPSFVPYNRHLRQTEITDRIRGMFGEFVPTTLYPSPIEIVEDLGNDRGIERGWKSVVLCRWNCVWSPDELYRREFGIVKRRKFEVSVIRGAIIKASRTPELEKHNAKSIRC